MVKAFLAVAGALLLTACSGISTGVITDKHHYPSHYTTTYICSGYNSHGMCTVRVPVINRIPDRYTFSLRQGEDTGWVYVSDEEFKSYEIGDTYGKADSN